MIHSNYIALNSRDSNSVESYLPSWTFNVPQHGKLTENYHMCLVNFQVPNTVYPVNEYYKQLSIVQDNTISFSFSLTENNYTGTQLASELETQLNALGGYTYTCTYDTQSKKIQVTCSGGTFEWSAINDYNAYRILGVTTFGVQTANYVGDVPINLSGSSYIDIISNLRNDNFSSTHFTSFYERIPIDVPFGNIIVYEPANKAPVQIQSHNGLFTVTFEMRDDQGNLFKLPTYSEVSCKLLVTGSPGIQY